MSNSTNISIDTRDRISGIPENCVFEFSDDFKIKTLRLLSIEFPNTFYNVRNVSTKYLSLDFNENDGLGDKTAIVLDAPLESGLEVGYTLAEFITAVQTAMNLASTSTNHTYAVTYNGTSKKVTIENTHISGSTFSLLTATGSNKNSRIFSYLGFSQTIDRKRYATYTGDLNLNIDTTNLIDTDSATLKMPVGSYTFDEFVTQLQTTLGVGTTVTLDNITNKVTITKGQVFTLDFASGSNVDISSFRELIGYTATDLSGASTYTSTGAINLGGDNYIYLKSESVVGNDQGVVSANTIDRNVLSRIQIDQVTDSIIFFTDVNTRNVDISNIPNEENRINFRLSLYRDQEPDLRGLEYSFVLNVTF
jgi:hypothetical protein